MFIAQAALGQDLVTLQSCARRSSARLDRDANILYIFVRPYNSHILRPQSRGRLLSPRRPQHLCNLDLPLVDGNRQSTANAVKPRLHSFHPSARSLCRVLSAQGRLVQGQPGNDVRSHPFCCPIRINELRAKSPEPTHSDRDPITHPASLLWPPKADTGAYEAASQAEEQVKRRKFNSF